jgi:hypothetical protein
MDAPVSNRSAAHGMRVSDVMVDDHELARRARTTLAGADAGLLLTSDDQGKNLTPISVRVIDDNGKALIRCPSGSAVAQAASAGRPAILVLAPNPSFGVRLTLSGRLGLIEGTNGRAVGGLCAACRAGRIASGTADIVVGLRVVHVGAACPRERPGVLSEARTVPNGVYADAEPDLFAAGIPRLVHHINEHHGELVRRLAAHTVGVPRSQLAAASVTDLTAGQASLCWLDESGAHQAVLPFAQLAPTLKQLAATWRACLTAANVNES